MSQFVFKMPDLGEGTVEAEIVAWHTRVGDSVREDQVIVEVMTDKAAVEVPAPVGGRVLSVSGSPGDKIAVGAPLIVFELDTEGDTAGGEDRVAAAPGAGAAEKLAGAPEGGAAKKLAGAPVGGAAGAGVAGVGASAGPPPGRVMVSPANRRRALEAGIALADVTGSGPGGRIVRADVEGAAVGAHAARAAEITEIPVIGVRRVIAERMSEAKRNIPHFSYVEEVDVTELEALRLHLNGRLPEDEPALTYLPLVVAALTRTLAQFPQCNVRYDAARGVLVRHRAVHVGIATQTPDGLKVPVVRDAGTRTLWELASEIRRVAERARTNRASRDELLGSTITVTSLGRLGGIASTPVINSPEVAIVGLNKAVERPVVYGGAVTVRRIMNLSSSFDHRFVDGYDAAAMIQALKDLLEHPATIFLP